MSRPVEHGERTSKTVRMTPELAERVKAAAAEREIGENVLLVAAISHYLDNLRPVEDLLRVRTASPETDVTPS